MKTKIEVEIPDNADHIAATDLRNGRSVLDGLLQGRVFELTRYGYVVGYAVPLPTDNGPTRSVGVRGPSAPAEE